jgi:undecaprenyl diphosphate synthase
MAMIIPSLPASTRIEKAGRPKAQRLRLRLLLLPSVVVLLGFLCGLRLADGYAVSIPIGGGVTSTSALQQSRSTTCRHYKYTSTRLRQQLPCRKNIPVRLFSVNGYPPHEDGHDSSNSNNNNPNPQDMTMPRHVAFICDGNSRWAKARKLPTLVGHAVGADRLVDLVTLLKRSNGGVQYATFYGFSTENWKRPAKEIKAIFTVVEQTARRFHARAIQEGYQVKVLGDLDDVRIPNSLRQVLQTLEKDSHAAVAATAAAAAQENKANEQEPLTICLAVNYGGRQDILQASVRLATAMAKGEFDKGDINEDVFSKLLWTSQIPDPDLIVRTSGECRVSNFLLWDLAYAEIYFAETLWPDFNENCWLETLEWYGQRKRRFGGRSSSSTTSSPTALSSHVDGLIR